MPRRTLSLLLVTVAAGAAAPAATAGAWPPHFTAASRVWPGVVFRAFAAAGARGPVQGYLLDVDLSEPRVTVGLLHPPVVAARERVSLMADAQHAVAGVNGDFFNISESHRGVPATGAAVGPEMADGRALKAAVPEGQRFGPRRPLGATTEEVIGVGADRVGRMTTLRLNGTVTVQGPLGPPANAPVARPPRGPVHGPPDEDLDDDLDDDADEADDSALRVRHPGRRHPRRVHASRRAPDGRLSIPLGGLNQYALPVGGVGLFTNHWGSASRRRAVCGTDAVRRAPCSADAAEVTVRRGVVTRVAAPVGGGTIPPGTTVLAGREAGADVLRRLRPGDHVHVAYDLAGPARLRFAVGGFAILRGGAPLPGLDAAIRAARTAAGVSANGRHLYLVVVDGRSPAGHGATLAELALLLRRAGAHDAMDLDGGGSSTLVLRTPGEPVVSVRNSPSRGAERAVANGVGVFVRADPGHARRKRR
ncbi:phosphodiester glycosidase family protein [Actinoallomurus sp. CA-142502]|uniref:phosphodiester glycosidase family protein n=1 Tax=Actinoallomurus sp. CA-142502 TaxID=3239885 RepID=UPI003D8E8F70